MPMEFMLLFMNLSKLKNAMHGGGGGGVMIVMGETLNDIGHKQPYRLTSDWYCT